MKAAHLKPLEKDDRLTDMKFTQPWNTQASKKKDDNGKLDNDNIPKVYRVNLFILKVTIFIRKTCP